MTIQLPMFDFGALDGTLEQSENPDFLTRQLITYIGNKRGLAGPLEEAVKNVRERIGGRTLRTLDLFSGSGFVSRLLKKHSSLVASNDLEPYARAVSECYLSNRDDDLLVEVSEVVDRLNKAAAQGARHDGFIQELYSPANDQDIQFGERAFYSNDNARRLDFYGQELQDLKPELRRLLLGPLLSKASIHTNTGGVFKGFYKDKNTGIGKFGARAGNATRRILAPIELEVPVMSLFETGYEVFQQDANDLISSTHEFDLIYIDPPYNQHPYGSNYFMLNLITKYERPRDISKVSGIPKDWNRSGYNIKKQSLSLLNDIFESAPARFLLVSFNSEGYVSTGELRDTLEKHGRVDEVIVKYNTFRASRNLRDRDIHINEHLFLLDRNN